MTTIESADSSPGAETEMVATPGDSRAGKRNSTRARAQSMASAAQVTRSLTLSTSTESAPIIAFTALGSRPEGKLPMIVLIRERSSSVRPSISTIVGTTCGDVARILGARPSYTRKPSRVTSLSTPLSTTRIFTS